MLDPATLRWTAVVLLLLAVVGVATFLRYNRPLGESGKRLVARRDAGFWGEVAWPLLVFAHIVALLAAAAFPEHVAGFGLPSFGGWGTMIQVAGVLAWLGGGALSLWAGRVMGRQMTAAIAVQDGHRLVTKGPYAYIRHPAYTSILLMTLGVALLLLNLIVFLAAVGVYVVARRRARLEEDLLASPGAFGDAYRRYTESTGRFLPRLRFGER